MATSLDDLRSLLFWRAVVAECLGTGFLVFVGCGSVTSWDDYSPTVPQIAFCFGLIVATMVWCIGNISGGHINPAVTMAMLVTRHVSLARGLLFMLAQCVGAVLGAAVLRGVTPSEFVGNLGQTTLNKSVSGAQGFGVEFMITFVLVFTVFSSVDSKRDDLNGSTPLTIGLSVAVCHLAAVSTNLSARRALSTELMYHIYAD